MRNTELQITTLIENEADDEKLLFNEHGLSLYIEFQGKKILFDTGQTGKFLENATKLEKSIEEADYIFVSHGHYDHSGGVPGLLKYLSAQENAEYSVESNRDKKIPLYVGNEFFHKKFKKLPQGFWHYNGNPFREEELENSQVALNRITEDTTYITEDIVVFKNFTKYTDFEVTNPKFFIKQDDNSYVQDEFVDEIALGLITTKGLVLIVGCSHVGIVNILENVKRRINVPIYSVLGGTHLVEADEERLEKTMAALMDFDLQQIAVSHCTGEQGMAMVKEAFGDGFIQNNTGNIYKV